MTDVEHLEQIVARGLTALMAATPVGASLPTEPYADAFVALERLIPAVLAVESPAWKHESVDGLRFARAVRSGAAAVDLLGVCILLGDQAVTPFSLQLEIADARSISSLWLRLGEPGTGQLGVSGPPCTSSAASTLRMQLPDREASIDWVYEASW